MLASASLAEGRRRYEARDYDGALAYANAVLTIDPWNSAAVALKMMSAGRARSREQSLSTAKTGPTLSAATPNATDTRPHKLVSRIPAKTINVPSLPGSSVQYVSKDATPPSAARRLWNGISSMVQYNLHRRTPEEAARLENVVRLLESTPSGRRLMNDTGGWEEIQKHVDVTFAPAAAPNILGYVRPIIPDAQGRRLTLVLNSNLLKEPDEVIAPILAHELTHVQHHLDGRISQSLAIPSEFAAHRQQVYVFLEISANLSSERREALGTSSRWTYQQFLADLWQDRILERFPTRETFVGRYLLADMERQALTAYDDLANGVVQVGSPHLDFHLVAPANGVYTVFTDEKDILDEVNARKSRPGYSESQRLEDERMLGRRAAITTPMDHLDSDYRAQNGWGLE